MVLKYYNEALLKKTLETRFIKNSEISYKK